MAGPGDFIDRREQPRYQAKEGAFAVLDFSHQTLKLGRINDISRSGLSFVYDSMDEWPRNPQELNILFGDDDFYLEKVPFETVSDTPVENDTPFATIKMRRRGIKFGKLAPRQQEELDYFLWHLTSGSV